MSQRAADLSLGLGVIVLAVYVLVESASFSERAAELPRLLVVLLLGLALVMIVGGVRRREPEQAPELPFADVPWRRWLAVVVALVLFGFLAEPLGFYEAAFVFLLATTWLLSRAEAPGLGPLRSVAVPLVFALICDAVLYVLFKIVLGIPTPPGLLI